MFSTREREYLRRVADGLDDGAAGSDISAGYRRKLQWSIRRKASRALSDWELYVSALEHDPRVAAPYTAERGGAVPTYTDPFITAARVVSSSLRRLTRRNRRPPAAQP